MKELVDELKNWADGINSRKMPRWESLPDIDLHMDQVITYMERQMNVFINNKEDKIITPSMINNYVKYKQIPSPVKKKYSREHLGYLLTVCMLKQVLPINDISKLINSHIENKEMSKVYDSFCTVQDEALSAISERVNDTAKAAASDDSEEVLTMLALKLAAEANASRIAAEKSCRRWRKRRKRYSKYIFNYIFGLINTAAV